MKTKTIELLTRQRDALERLVRKAIDENRPNTYLSVRQRKLIAVQEEINKLQKLDKT